MMRAALRVRSPPSLLKSSPGGTGEAVPVGVSEVDEAVVVLIVIIILEVLVPGESKNEVETVDMEMLTEVEVVEEVSKTEVVIGVWEPDEVILEERVEEPVEEPVGVVVFPFWSRKTVDMVVTVTVVAGPMVVTAKS